MALVFNNIIINKNSDKYKPFLFNLISGRRRLLNPQEFIHVCSMHEKQNISYFTEGEMEPFNNLVDEKQFVTEEARANIENQLVASGYFQTNTGFAEDFSFAIELTRSCNMKCSYCYAKSRIDNNTSMTKDHIDGIYEFFRAYADEQDKILKTKHITITGGEPLINVETVELINYIASIWHETKLYLLTNGVNILKYYDRLPLNSIKEVQISLDGVKDVHMSRRYSDSDVDYNIYDDIIAGIKKLLEAGVTVRAQTVYDKTSYLGCAELVKYLEEEGILQHPNFDHDYGMVIDFSNPLDLDTNYNDKYDMMKIWEYASETNTFPPPVLPSATILYGALSRPKDEPFMPKHYRCECKKLSNCFFSCDGSVYVCDNITEGKGTIGTFYPSTSIDNDAVSKLLNRSVMQNDTCRKCAYKFVCLGGCIKSAEGQGTEMACGIFADEELLDNLEYNFY